MKVNVGICHDATSSGKMFQLRLKCSELPYSFRNESLEWSVAYKSSKLTADDLLGFAGSPSVLLLNGFDKTLVDQIRSLESQIQTLLKNNPAMPLVPSPVIVVLSPAAQVEIVDFPNMIADWVYAPVTMPDLAKRILFTLKRRGMLKKRLQFCGIVLFPETYQVTDENRSIRLTPSEFALLELFVDQMGTVMPFRDLVYFFKSTGKSSETNNIRVAIFQLRLKLEILTKSRITLVNIYKQGYCLRQKGGAHTCTSSN